MGRFLRDELIKNLTLDEDALALLGDTFQERATGYNVRFAGDDQSEKSKVHLFYIIRFDNKGYRLYQIEEVLKFYRQAKNVERIIYCLESFESLNSNRVIGTYMELRLDSKDENSCQFVVSSDDRDWVDSSFTGIRDIISKQTNNNAWIRNSWTPLLVQIFGVTAGFALSLWAGVKIAPHLAIESAFVFSFIFAFLLFSNVWTYLNQQIARFFNYCFPNVRFQRKGKDKLHWFLQVLVGGIFLALALYLLNELFSFIGKVLGEFIVK